MANETLALATFAAQLTYENIPASARTCAINLLVDQIGIELACSDLPWARQVRDATRRAGGAPEATVVRYGDRLPLGATAFINSTFGHSFEFDDGNPLIHGHPGAELIPSLLALAERDHLSGVDFLTAFVAGYEIRGHIGWAVSPDMLEKGGPQYSTTCGPFGVAAAVGKLLRLSADGIHEALGIAGSYSGGLMQYDHGGGSVKRIFTAIAASSGLQAALLAQAGITGPAEILEGARGLLRIYAPQFRPEKLVQDLGSKWTLELVRFKPYSCCGGIHPAIDALKKITAAHRLGAADIAHVEVTYPLGIDEHVGITAPHDLLGMQFSTAYSLALTMLKGNNTPREYTTKMLSDAQVKDFASRVHVRGDPELNKKFEGHQPARVEVRTFAGALHEELVIDAKGSPRRPLTGDELDAKFRAQAAGVLGGERCEKLLQTLRAIEAIGDVAAIAPLCVAE